MTTVSVRSSHPLAAAAGLLLCVALVIVYVPVLLEIAAVSWNVSYYSHALLVPVFSAWLVRDALRSGRRSETPDLTASRRLPALLELALVTAGVGLLAAGSVAGSLTLRALSIPLVAAGVTIAAVGRARASAVLFPLAFLVFMAPLPDGTIPRLSLPLQHVAADSATWALGALGIPAVQEGLFIHLPGVTLHVSEACNGLRFLLAMVPVGVAFAALAVEGASRRTVTVLTAVVIAILANMLRVTGTGIIAYTWGATAASGLPHIVYGKLVYALMLVPFVGVVLLLRRSFVWGAPTWPPTPPSARNRPG
jgi:exosortase